MATKRRHKPQYRADGLKKLDSGRMVNGGAYYQPVAFDGLSAARALFFEGKPAPLCLELYPRDWKAAFRAELARLGDFEETLPLGVMVQQAHSFRELMSSIEGFNLKMYINLGGSAQYLRTILARRSIVEAKQKARA